MAGFSNLYENLILDHLFGLGPPLEQFTKWVGLCTADPGEAGGGGDCDEVLEVIDSNPSGYARVETADHGDAESDWEVPGAEIPGRVMNVKTITFPEALENWGVVSHFILINTADWSTGGVLFFGPLYESREIIAGSVPRFDPGALVITVD